ncbi:hypothetical protein [Actinosynnema sp. NPDC020468]|uniref:hypothetical protein n=1 Tax=Actinosynnema sp. NPDC020468 TaxID=3154488 RepID=UPI0033CF86BC
MDIEAVDTALAKDDVPKFGVVVRGYDRRQVDEYVHALAERARRDAAALEAAERDLARLRAREPVAAPALATTAPEPVVVTAPSHFGERVAEIVAYAEQQAEAVVREAKDQAEKLRQDAERHASVLMRDANAQASDIRRGAEQEAEQVAADLRSRKVQAEAEAVRVERAARQRADDVIAQAVGRLRVVLDAQSAIVDGLKQVGDLVGAAKSTADTALPAELTTAEWEIPPSRTAPRAGDRNHENAVVS